MKKEADWKKKIKKHAIINAFHYGKAKADKVLPKLFQEGLKKDQIKEILPLIKKIVNEVNSLPREKIKKEYEKLSKELPKKEKKESVLPPLPNAKKGKVVVRFAPFPSGPLHIGNARPVIINDEYAKKYNGKFLLVIDDTIGSEEKKISKDAYKLIPQALDWLGIDYETPIIYKSDRLEIYYHYAKELIKKGKAYVCFCSAKELRENRIKGRECEHRNFSVERNLLEFENMVKGKYKEGEATLRLKTDMKHKNPAFRDRVLFRICEREHPRVGKKYKVWPMLEFSWAIDDYLLGITHVIRGKELMMESEMEKYIWNILGWQHPVLIHLGLLNIEGVKISKSKSREEVEKGIYFGWDDPRTWSIQSLARRGFKPEAIRKFVLQFGLTQTEVKVPIEILYKENRKLIDEANRYFFVFDPVKIKVTGIKERKREELKMPLHPTIKKGYRKIKVGEEVWISKKDFEKLKENETVRLMHYINVRIKKRKKEFIFHSSGLENIPKETRKIHWLPCLDSEIVKVKILMPNGEWISGLAEKNIKKIKKGGVVQFERFGFVRLDKKGREKIEFWFAHP